MITSLWTLSYADMLSLKITDPYSIHRIVYDLFEDVRSESQKGKGEPSGFLYVDREGNTNLRQILILSNRSPKTPSYGNLKSHTVPPALFAHDRYRFEVMINPSKRDNKTKKTVAVRGREAIADWFLAKAPKSWGFSRAF